MEFADFARMTKRDNVASFVDGVSLAVIGQNPE
jgi:hypothetical protein